MAELEKLLCTDSKVESLKKINAIADAIGDGDLANKDLSNLSATGQAKFTNLQNSIDNKVSKSGDTMTGVLNIEHNTWGSLILKNSNIDINTPPSAKQYMGMDFRDNAGNRLGFFGIQQDTTGETFITFQTQKSKGILAPTPATGDNSTKIATTAFVNTVLPAGTIVSSGSSSTPTGYLYCNGSAVSRTTYAKLFSAIGTTYGTGDGSTTFNLPNYSNYNFVTSATVSVYGDGKTLGMEHGNSRYGTICYGNSRIFSISGDAYGQPNTGSYGISSTTEKYGLGVTREASKSGLTGSVSTATIKWYIKY